MKKIWYISINNTQEGPYSVPELKADVRITPDTLAWRDGFPRWIKIRDIPELRDLFKDEEDDKEEESSKPKIPFDELAIAYQHDPNSIFWIIVLAFALFYFIYRVNS